MTAKKIYNKLVSQLSDEVVTSQLIDTHGFIDASINYDCGVSVSITYMDECHQKEKSIVIFGKSGNYIAKKSFEKFDIDKFKNLIQSYSSDPVKKWLSINHLQNRSSCEREWRLPTNSLNPYQLDRQGLSSENLDKLRDGLFALSFSIGSATK